MVLFLLFESASGFGLFEQIKGDEIEILNATRDITELSRFSQLVKLVSFIPFTSAESALEQINAVSEGEATPFLVDWLQTTLPNKAASKKVKKEGKVGSAAVSLGVTDAKLGGVIKEVVGVDCVANDMVNELIRGIRQHITHFIKELTPADWTQAQLGLAHAYSRSKVKFNVHRVDNMIIQSSALLDQLDKDLNTFSMRVREWYSWHFPELIQIVNDNTLFAKCAIIIQNKSTLNEDKLHELEEILQDESKARLVIEAAKKIDGN